MPPGVSVYALQAKATARVDVPETPTLDVVGMEHREVGVSTGVSVLALQAKATARVDVPETPTLDVVGMEHREVGVPTGVSVLALQAKATARVDVPETPTLDDFGMEHDEQKSTVFPVLLRTFTGKHLVLSCSSDMSFVELISLIEHKSGIPSSKFLLIKDGKLLGGSASLSVIGIVRDDVLCMSARLLGGSKFPGEWHCAGCNRGGCWHTKQWCFRCGLSRAESEAMLGGRVPVLSFSKGSGKGKGWGKGAATSPPREQNYPGRTTVGPQFTTAPTFSEARSKKKAKPAASQAQMSQVDLLPHIVRLLADIGCNQETLDRVQDKVNQVKTVAKPVPGEKERMLYVLKAKLDKAAGHLEHLRNVAKQKELAYMKANDEVSAQEAVLQDLNAQHEQAKLKVMVGSSAGSDTGETQQGPDIESEREMSDIDPDLAPADWGLNNNNGVAASSACAEDPGQPPPPPEAVTTLPDQIFPDEQGRMKVMKRWPLSSVQQMHVWCQERLEGASDGTLPSG